jgi:uncharacterized protein YndB with AHSA1/START domain
MTDFDAGPLADVTAEPAGPENWTLVFVRDLPHPQALVWAALTDPDRLDQWAPFAAEKPLDAVGASTLTMIDGDNRVPMPAMVRRADAPTLLEYEWGTDVLRWELAATDAGTRLTLRHTVAARDLTPMVAAGWHLCLAVADRLLAGNPVGVIRGQAAMAYGWQELHDAYAEVLKVQ